MRKRDPGAKRLSVLVVDDDRETSRLLKRTLEDSDTEVIEAASGAECVKALGEGRVDLLLLDIRLPDFSGWGVLSLVRLTEALHDMPVIVVSEEPPNAAMMERLKPDDYVQKPFDMRDLLSRVTRITGGKSPGGAG
ncbi:MAG: response regulator [Dehalococcoidales bacterium]